MTDDQDGSEAKKGPTLRKILYNLRAENPGGQERINSFLKVYFKFVTINYSYN